MPLGNHRSICAPNAKIIVSKDVGNREHRGLNPNQRHVTHYKIDGEIITTGPRCDFVLINESDKIAYLIELKGSKLSDAARQLEATENALKNALDPYDLRYRIVSSRSKTQQIESADFKKYRERWKSRLVHRTNEIEEKI